MLTGSWGGMALGLIWDINHGSMAQLGSLCIQSTGLGLLDAVQLHLHFLPGIHVGMLSGGVLALTISPSRAAPGVGKTWVSLLAHNLLCVAWMLGGMAMGALWQSWLPTLPQQAKLLNMLLGMFGGMACGMLACMVVHRTIWRPLRAQSPTRREVC